MNNFFIRVFLIISLLFFSFQSYFSQQLWINTIDSVSTLSSPRSIDLNNDGIKDIVVGAGTDSTFSYYGVVAFDGNNGDLLWSLPTPDEIFTSAIFNDINNDDIPEVFIGGRNAQLYAIDGATGSIVWEYFPQNLGIDPADSSLYNFYSAQFLDDQNGDNVPDLLVTNGGDHKAGLFDPRPSGNIMIVSGVDGNLLAIASTPDSAEIYCSPVILDHGTSSTPNIIFGTGGEQNGGSMFVTTLQDLLNNDISNAIVLTSNLLKGFIAPASLADFTNDGFLDIVVQSFDGVIQAFDGLTFQSIWSKSFAGCESSSAPTIGNFTGGDLVPDVFNVVYKGTTPTYFDYYQLMIDGATGELSFFDSIGSMQFPSSTAFDANGDGRDEVLISINNISSYFSHQLKLIDFQNDTIIDITENQAGVNLACTPLIDDLDQDGNIEFIYTCKIDSTNPSAWKGFNIYRHNTSFNVPLRGIAWGAYMGTSFDGHYTNLLVSCQNTDMIATWLTANPSCNLHSDGRITPNQVNSPPHTFLWSDGSVDDTLVDVLAGNYFVYLTDSNNCLEIHNFQLNEPYNISFGNIIHNNCVGDSTGSVTVSSSGCVCQFSTCSYNWSNGSLIKHATQLPFGFHSVDLTHSDGCIVTDSIYVNDGSPVIDNATVVDLACYHINDGMITLFPTDSMSTTYTWSNGSISSVNDYLSPGNYNVIVNNTYCNDSLSFTVNSQDTVNFTANSENLSCFEDSSGLIEFFPIGNNFPFQFYVNNTPSQNAVFSNLNSGVYQIYIQDALNCYSDTIEVSLNQPDDMNLTFEVTPVSNPGFMDGTINSSVSGGTPPYIFNWDSLPGINDSFIVYLSNGTYNLEVIDDNGCQILDSVNVGILSTVNQSNNRGFNIYPIPSYGEVKLSNNYDQTLNYLIYDVNGKVIIKDQIIESNNYQFINLETGSYLLKAFSNSLTLNKKIIVR